MIRRLVLGALVTSGIALAAPPDVDASKAKDIPTCMKVLEDRGACKEDVCEVELEGMAKQTEALALQMPGHAPPEQMETLNSRRKQGCVAHLAQEGKDANTRRAACERMAAVGSLQAMLDANEACASKPTCKERAACAQPFLEKEAARQRSMRQNGIYGAMGHGGRIRPRSGTAHPLQQRKSASPPQQAETSAPPQPGTQVQGH